MNGSAVPAGRELRHRIDVFRVLVGRDLKAMYKRSFLGFGWALGLPVVQLLVFTMVFRRVLSVEVENYPVFVFTGVLAWGWFQSSLGEGVGLITGNRALVGQPGFPLVILPHVTVAVRGFHFAVALPLLFGLMLWSGIRPAWPWLMVPVLAAIQYLLAVGLCYPLAALNVRFRDTQHVVRVLLQMAMFLTPVFYDVGRVPESILPWYRLNPMVGMIESWRDVLLRGQWPDPLALGILMLVGAGLFAGGRVLFVRQSHRFLEEI